MTVHPAPALYFAYYFLERVVLGVRRITEDFFIAARNTRRIEGRDG